MEKKPKHSSFADMSSHSISITVRIPEHGEEKSISIAQDESIEASLQRELDQPVESATLGEVDVGPLAQSWHDLDIQEGATVSVKFWPRVTVDVLWSGERQGKIGEFLLSINEVVHDAVIHNGVVPPWLGLEQNPQWLLSVETEDGRVVNRGDRAIDVETESQPDMSTTGSRSLRP